MFSSCGNKGFQITFANGNTVSVQWGPMNYCNPEHPSGRNAPYDAPMKASEPWASSTAEVAAWDSEGKWHNFGSDNVSGWMTPEEVNDFMQFVATNELVLTPVWTDDSEDDSEEDDSADTPDGSSIPDIQIYQ